MINPPTIAVTTAKVCEAVPKGKDCARRGNKSNNNGAKQSPASPEDAVLMPLDVEDIRKLWQADGHPVRPIDHYF